MKKLGIITMLCSLLFAMNAYAAVDNNDNKTAISNFVSEVYPNISAEEKEQLTEKLYEEKYGDSKSITFSDTPIEPYIQEEDPLYIAMIEKENYIVDLINQLGGTATYESWEYNLDFLNEHLDEIKLLDDVNMEYVNAYIYDYTSLKESKKNPTEKVYTGQSLLANGYDYDAAVNYARLYVKNYNPNYPDWTPYGGDCANFASQCLYAGGKPMRGTNPNDALSWFSSGTATDTNKVSGAWRGANMFRNYWQEYSTAYKQFSRGGTDTYNYTWPGDVVSLLNNNGLAYHTLICTSFISSTQTTTCFSHTGSASRDLSTVTVPLIVYHVRDSY